MKKKEGTYLQALAMLSHFWLLLQTIFKRVVLAATSVLPLLAPSFALPFLPSHFKFSRALMME
jgi:hypothetical protein